MNFIFLLLITVSISAQTMNIEGTYKGNSKIQNNNYYINLKNIDVNEFSNYEDIYPYTGGYRAFLYFDLDGKKGADVAGYIYRRVMVIRGKSKNGLYNIPIAQIPIKKLKNKNIKLVFPKDYLSNKPTKIWTYQMGYNVNNRKKNKSRQSLEWIYNNNKSKPQIKIGDLHILGVKSIKPFKDGKYIIKATSGTYALPKEKLEKAKKINFTKELKKWNL